MLAVLTASASLASVRVAVFGGSGFLGSRICKTLSLAGCDVVSISRAGKAPKWAASESWSEQVEWKSADLLMDESITLGRIDGAVSCIGNVRPARNFEDGSFFGLHWDAAAMQAENGAVNARAVEAAQLSGASHFVYVSVDSMTKYAFGGALEDFVAGKLEAEAAVRRSFGENGATFVAPHLLYGGERFASVGKLMASVFALPPVRGYLAGFRKLKSGVSSGFGPQDASSEVFASPPTLVEDAAQAVAACVLGTYDASVATGEAIPKPEGMPRIDGSGWDDTPPNMVDGSFAIKAVAKQFGGADRLAAAAASAVEASSSESAGTSQTATVSLTPAELPPDFTQSESAYGSAWEGAIMGWRPFLYPFPPAATLFGAFAWAINYGPANQAASGGL